MDSNHPQPDLRCAIVGHPSRFEGIPQHMTALRDAWATATVADLASEMEDLHDFWCNCGLDLGLTEYIWRTDLVCEQDRDAALEIYHPSKSNAQRLDQHTLLRDIVLSPLEDLYQVTIHVMLGRDLDDAERGKIFTGVRRLRGDVCRVSYSLDLKLPGPQATEFPSVPGTVYVDKSELLVPFYANPPSGRSIAIIRRPARYGKSMFLSICSATYGDRHCHAFLPQPRTGLQEVDQLLVLRLDFAALDFCAGLQPAMFPSDEAMYEAGRSFMQQASLQFWKLYAPDRAQVVDECAPSPHHASIRSLARQCGQKLFLAIDNYTHPFRTYDDDMEVYDRIEYAIWRSVIAPLLENPGIERGLVTGEDLPGLTPWTGYRAFAETTMDLTNEAAVAHAIGLRVEDVADLGCGLLGPDFNVNSEVFERFHVLTTPGSVLCTGDIVDALRACQDGTSAITQLEIHRIAREAFEDEVPGLTPASSHEDGFDSEPKTPPQTDAPVQVVSEKDDQNVVFP